MKVNCKFCGKEFNARPADIKRGWGKFCSKSCKAKWQVRNNPKDNYKNYMNRKHRRYERYEYSLTEGSTGTFFTTVERCEFCGKFDCECYED